MGTIIVRGFKAGTKELVQEIITKNAIMIGPSLGMDIIVQWLLGNTTIPVGINWLAIGTGNNPVTTNDTQLQTEVLRGSITSSQDDAFSTAILQTFFPDLTLPNETYYEAGGFINATLTPDSGLLFDHALLSVPYAKAPGTDTTLEIDISLTQ